MKKKHPTEIAQDLFRHFGRGRVLICTDSVRMLSGRPADGHITTRSCFFDFFCQKKSRFVADALSCAVWL